MACPIFFHLVQVCLAINWFFVGAFFSRIKLSSLHGCICCDGNGDAFL